VYTLLLPRRRRGVDISTVMSWEALRSLFWSSSWMVAFWKHIFNISILSASLWFLDPYTALFQTHFQGMRIGDIHFNRPFLGAWFGRTWKGSLVQTQTKHSWSLDRWVGPGNQGWIWKELAGIKPLRSL